MNAIDVEDLKKSYNGSEMALKGISCSIEQGAIFGFLGPNGAGKTTTVRLLNGILTPSGGKAQIMGFGVGKDNEEIHKTCGVMTETALMYENLSGIENLKFYGKLHGMPAALIKDSSNALLESLELKNAGDKKVKAYSTGMKRRLALARALLHRPKVLFLDEPTSGLDPESAINVTRMIKRLSVEQGVTVFICTHQLKYAEEICTHYGFIHDGSLIGVGTFNELLAQKNNKKYIEIRGEDLPQIKSAERTEDGNIRIPINTDAEVPAILGEILSSCGRIYEARQVKWNLEDLYFSFEKEASL